jgi:transposase
MDISEVTAGRPHQARRMRTNAEKRRIVEETMSGGASVAEVARRHGVNANLLFNWRKLYQQGLLDRCRQPAAAKLLPVHVAPAPSDPVAADLPSNVPGTIEIALPGDIRVRVHGRADPATLAEVLAVLGSR